jgi:hypothetical protein
VAGCCGHLLTAIGLAIMHAGTDDVHEQDPSNSTVFG